MQKNVVVLLRTGSETGRNMLAGILKRIKDSDRCAIRIAGNADYFSKASASASALIANVSAPVDTVRKALADGKPVVLLNDWRFKEHPDNLGHVRTDDGEIGFRAADYFLSIGKFRSFGYVHAQTGREWSAKRGRAFAYRLGRKGHDCLMFGTGKSADGDLSAWLRDLPKPAAVFCAWDSVAADVAYAAKKAKIRIPSQMVLLGVDNDEAYCTSSSPQISSIEFDAEREGAMAADLALKMLSPRRKAAKGRIVCCGAVKRIVERESTRPPAPAALLIERALKYISENAARGIGPQDVANSLGISRTLLDLRFREMADATVGEYILERRLDLLATMLRKSKSPIARLTGECGFRSVNYAKAVFKKHFGKTMREYRYSLHVLISLPKLHRDQ